MWFLYIARFRLGLYAGITTDPKRRIQEHNSGLGAKSLVGKGPVVLVYLESYPTQLEAAKREKEIKGWSRAKKLLLIKNNAKRFEGFTLRNEVTKGA